MLKFHWLFLFLLLPSLVKAQAPISFVLKGQLNPCLNPPAKVYVYQKGEVADSAEVKGGTFELHGTALEPQKSVLVLSRVGNRKELKDYKSGFYLENGTLVFSSSDSLKYATVAGAQLTDEWNELSMMKKPVIQQMSAMHAEYKAASLEERRSSTFLHNRDIRDKAIAQQRYKINSIFIKAHPNSLVSLDELDLMSNDKSAYALVDSLLPVLSPSLRDSPKAQKILAKIHIPEEILMVGMQAPNFILSTSDGKKVSLNQYLGKYILIDFWASWCGPCRQENPNLVRVYNQYSRAKFDILSISINTEDERSKWLKAVFDDKLPWQQVIDVVNGHSQVANQYHIKAIPQNFLLNPQGKIIALNLRGDSLQAILTPLIIKL